ncbi:hypothetical protein [Amycolatopsis sp. cg9]|uniref:hypothetical protein n=1 Tax=Amycolatopsis sp. cg9 TaxID=3238801 RepID=UPI003524DBFF
MLGLELVVVLGAAVLVCHVVATSSGIASSILLLAVGVLPPEVALPGGCGVALRPLRPRARRPVACADRGRSRLRSAAVSAGAADDPALRCYHDDTVLRRLRAGLDNEEIRLTGRAAAERPNGMVIGSATLRVTSATAPVRRWLRGE